MNRLYGASVAKLYFTDYKNIPTYDCNTKLKLKKLVPKIKHNIYRYVITIGAVIKYLIKRS